MAINIRNAASKLIRLVPGSAARTLSSQWRDLGRLKDADVAFVSFPKSGRTFVRAMLARLYQIAFGIDERDVLKFATLREAQPSVPRVLFTHDGDAMRRPGQIRVNRKAYRRCRVVLLARHPGDVAVSRYHHLKYRSLDRVRQQLAQQPLETFIWTEYGGVPSIVRFLNQWARFSRVRPDILNLRYEDFIADTFATLESLALFIGLLPTDQDLEDAVDCARFESLKVKERAGYFAPGRFGPGRAGHDQSFKVRSGKPGGFRVALPTEVSDAVEAYVRVELDPVFGYGR